MCFFLLLCPYLSQFKHGFQGKLVLNKVIFHISVIGQISKTLNSPLPCFGIYLGIAKPPGIITGSIQSVTVMTEVLQQAKQKGCNCQCLCTQTIYQYSLSALLGQFLGGALSKLPQTVIITSS